MDDFKPIAAMLCLYAAVTAVHTNSGMFVRLSSQQ
jgi:hypothetical protein